MHVTEHARLEKTEIPGIEHRTLASAAQGLQHLSIWRQRVALDIRCSALWRPHDRARVGSQPAHGVR